MRGNMHLQYWFINGPWLPRSEFHPPRDERDGVRDG